MKSITARVLLRQRSRLIIGYVKIERYVSVMNNESRGAHAYLRCHSSRVYIYPRTTNPYPAGSNLLFSSILVSRFQNNRGNIIASLSLSSVTRRAIDTLSAQLLLSRISFPKNSNDQEIIFARAIRFCFLNF